jgi:gliding motility-associated-like protein
MNYDVESRGMKKFVRLLSFFVMAYAGCQAQELKRGTVTCDFTFRDTVCRNTPVTITDLSQGATTYFWAFCKGTPLSFPSCSYSGALPGELHGPLGTTLVQEGNKYYAFITNSIDSTILRVTYTNSMINPPTYNNLQISGILTQSIFGIQVKNYNGSWYGFVTNGRSLVRLDFGASLANLAPTATTIASSPQMNLAQGLVIGYDGTDWVGFCTNFPAKTVTRFSWGNDLSSIPIVNDLGNLGGLTRPMQPALINDGTGWYMFVANTLSLVQIQFGNSLLNTPTGTNLGNLTWITDNRGVSMFMECGTPYSLLVNHDVVQNQLMQVHFIGGLGGTKVITPLGNTCSLEETVALSETLNIGDTLFCIAVNSKPSISVLYFPPCITSILPTSSLFDPSPVVFPNAGSYTIKLTVDMGMSTEQQTCKEIEVDSTSVYLGRDTTLCVGETLLLDAGTGYRTYSWNAGGSGQTFSVSTSGTYTVTITDQQGCSAEDSIRVVFNPNINTTVDTSICAGNSYFAGGKQQTTSGTYIDTLQNPNGCHQFITTRLTVKPSFTVNIGKDTCITDTTTITLVARVLGATDFTWQDGTHDSIVTVTQPGTYWVKVEVDGCVRADSIYIVLCPVVIPESVYFMPTAFTPNGDGLNDVFRPIGTEKVDFHLIIYDRWGQMIFETSDLSKGWDGTFKGSKCEPGVYTYILTYTDATAKGGIKKTSGFVTLVR